MSGRSLEERVAFLEKQLERKTDREKIENLISVHQHYLAGNQGPRALRELWAQTKEDVSMEIGASGVYLGLRNIRKYYEKDIIPGRLMVHALTTPDIEIDLSGERATGLWFNIGVESDAGELGEHPPKTLEARELLTSSTPDGKRYLAEWVWGKLQIEFIRENGCWKIWHYHFYELFRCPYHMDWVQFSTLRQYADGIRIEAMFASNLPFGPDEPPENNADYATTQHWQYRTDAVAELLPEPPTHKFC